MTLFLSAAAVTIFQIHGGGNFFLRFSTEIPVYLGNGKRQAHGDYGSVIGSHRLPIDLCQFQ